MLTHLKSFTRDEHGFVVTTELVLVATLCVLGLVTGLSCIRDAVNGELGDVAHAIGSLNQSYRFTGFHGCVSPKCGVHAWTAGSAFTDLQDETGRAGLDDGPAPATQVQPAPKTEACPVQEQAPAAQLQPEIAAIPCPVPVVEGLPCPTSMPTCCESQIAPIRGEAVGSPSCCEATPAPLTAPPVSCGPRITVSPMRPTCPAPVSSGFLVW